MGVMNLQQWLLKFHIAVDVLRLPHAIMVTLADRTDRNGAIEHIRLFKRILLMML